MCVRVFVFIKNFCENYVVFLASVMLFFISFQIMLNPLFEVSLFLFFRFLIHFHVTGV